MKKCIVITALLFLGSNILLAQLTYRYTPYSIGAGGGLAQAAADLSKQINKSAFFINFNYNYSPYVTFTAELQAGKLAGGDRVTDKDTRAFENSFKDIVFYADFQLGEFIDYRDRKFLNMIKNFYAGTGFGVIQNKMTSIQRTSLIDPTYVFPGQDASTELMLPLRAGYEFKIYNYYLEPYIRINAGYQVNLVYGEGLDGYNDPPKIFKNHSVDRYSLISVSVKYSFGAPVTYKKPINRFYQ